MKVAIDRGKCTGHGRCFSLSPDVFDCDDQGFGLVVIEDVEPDDDDLVEQSTNAALNCPESAIRVEA